MRPVASLTGPISCGASASDPEYVGSVNAAGWKVASRRTSQNATPSIAATPPVATRCQRFR